MWDDLHWSNITRWLVTAIVWLFLLSFVTDFREHLGYDIYLIVVTIAVAYWATRRGPRQERIEAYLKVVANRVLFTNNEQARLLEEGRRLRADQTILIREYDTQADYQREATVLHAEGWRVTSSISQQPRSGCLRILTLGIFALVFHPKAVLVITYERERS